MEHIRFEQEWLNSYEYRKSSSWKHDEFYNSKLLFNVRRKGFESSISLDGKRYFGDLWFLDYVISLIECKKLCILDNPTVEEVLGRSTDIRKPVSVKFFSQQSIRDLFKIVSSDLSPQQKRMKSAKINHDFWMELHGNIKVIQKHHFMNIQTLFTTRTINSWQYYSFEKKVLTPDLWTLDYIISIEKAEKKELITPENSALLRRLLFSSDMELGLSMIRQPSFYRMLKSL